ncbi:hypothetical protein HPB47_020164 [Ixodes persulcatus]|uniref:Uncharacterized protein n=1 Tax=Ixodes persulcatus TaxID=34615 RepID=A0AC60QGD5_IXOPE|nr:hypothetical protein HPB47_020164 [Ixodes persulcatus]
MVIDDGTSSAPSESEGENQMSGETDLHHSAMSLNDATKAGVDKQGNALQYDRPQDAGSAMNNTDNVTAHTDTQGDGVPSKALSGVTHMSFQEIHVPVAAKKLASEAVQIRPPRGITREVIIAGDGNVLRIVRALIEEVHAPQSMEFITNRGATTEVVHKIIETYEEKARNVPRMYILHVGLNDVLKGEQPDTIIERLRLQWAKRKASLAICSVPEIDGRGKEVRATTMLLNAKLKQLCKRIRARFIDLSRELASIPAMQKDGLHYRTEGSQVVTDRVGALVTHCLELQRRDNFSGHTGSNRGRYGTHPTVVNRSEAGKKAHAHDLPGLSSGPRTSGAHRVVNTPPLAKETVKQPVPNFPGPVYSPQRQRDHPPQSSPLHAIWVPPLLTPPNGHLQGQSSGAYCETDLSCVQPKAERLDGRMPSAPHMCPITRADALCEPTGPTATSSHAASAGVLTEFLA